MQPLTDREYLLEKFPGKGGWTFAQIPEIPMDKHSHFGWVRVRGSIDAVEINQYHLMPMGNGYLFLPVKAAIRKKIGKEAGDTVHVILYPDDSALVVPDDIRICLDDAPRARTAFYALSQSEQKAYLDWINGAKKEETQAKRIVEMIAKLESG